jgi:hypothetical protein
MRVTYLLFLDSRERDGVVVDLSEQMRGLRRSLADGGEPDLVMPFRLNPSSQWPMCLRSWTGGTIEPASIIQLVTDAPFEHPVMLVLRSDQDHAWSYHHIFYKPSGEEL